MWSLITLSLLACLSLSTCQRMTARETNTCEGRQTPGLICESCELLATCVKYSNGWFSIPVETCDVQNGFFCNSRLGMCSNMTGPCHPFGAEGNFPCPSHGIFPDPYDCQKYHMCYFVGGTLVSASVDCGSDKAFNAATGQCSLSIDSIICRQKQFECVNVGDAHAWPNSPNIFYICKATSNQEERVLYPQLYRCADGEIFDGYFCRATIATDMPPVTVGPGQPITTSTSTVAPGLRCTNVGLTSDTENCRKYYYCSAVNGAFRHMECPTGTFYNDVLAACVVGQC